MLVTNVRVRVNIFLTKFFLVKQFGIEKCRLVSDGTLHLVIKH